ncbi:ribosylnicotinamide kinase [Marasmius tenuissimus]|uniref:Ribosylnicotinamide kinase n=1 Tax=Marasmius tenuissimus TaxID=585030 RepID=A0ABR3AGR2_9AGAR
MVKTRVVLVGIGGATCSGKTTLAKHLRRILPNSVIMHQDDFAPPQEKVPFHPTYKVQDWDAPAGAIEWPRLVKFLETVKETGVIPPDHRSHDHLNEQKQVPLSDTVSNKWRAEFERLEKEAESQGEKIVWGLVDGFLLYWHPDVIKQLEVRIFLRVPHDTLKRRRHERHGYHTAVQSDPEGSLWRDPPAYWEQIVWPAYIEAHREAFVDGDVENGMPSDKVKEILLINSLEIGMDEIVERSCAVLRRQLKES